MWEKVNVRLYEHHTKKVEEVLQAIPEIKEQALQSDMNLQVSKESLRITGNSYSLLGTLRLPESKLGKKINIKLTTSPNKFLDFKREEFMYSLIRKMGYPTPSVFISGEVSNGGRFLIREYIEGTQLRGAPRAITRVCLPDLISFFCDLHTISLEGFGHIEPINDEWKGKSENWIESLETKARQSFARMKQSKIAIRPELLDRLLSILSKHSDLLEIRYKSILHGDAGLINFLGNEKGLIGVIDTEFALVGDPAYEFSDKIGEDRDYSIDFLNKYLGQIEKKGLDIKRESFLDRGIIYSPFIVTDIIPNLWEAGNHDSATYFVSILPNEIEKTKSV